MTDETRTPDPLKSALALPPGAAIILRHRNRKLRAELARQLAELGRQRGLSLLISDDAVLAARVRADGLHLPEAHARQAAHWRALRPSWLITAAAHSARGLSIAAACGADAAILAPVFPTSSHEDRASLGAVRFRLIALRSVIRVYALGGVNAATVGRLKDAALAGIAGIGGLLDDQSL
jgi:thiamine-phosphate pyrophosphorylase